MSVEVSPSTNDLTEIAGQVWESYLDPEGKYPFTVLDGPEVEQIKRDIDGMCASVSVTGAWHGHVVVACSTRIARVSAAALLMMEVDEVGIDDMVDALGELVNIVGGNVKSTLPSVCAMSLPHVSSGLLTENRWPGAAQVCELVVNWMDEPMSISVWQSSRKEDRTEATR
jgi:chemotaxis protein CheX